MRKILLVAWHEFYETIRSKTYLFGLVITPVMFAAGLFLPGFLDRTFTPDRPVIVIDRGGDLGDAVKAHVRLGFTRDKMAALYTHVRGFAKASLKQADGELDPDKVPLEFMRRRGDITRSDAQAFLDKGGIGAGLERAQPLLREGAPPPSFEPAPFEFVELPPNLAQAVDARGVSAALAPYLKGEKTLPPRDGEKAEKGRELYAALVLPASLRAVKSDTPAFLGLSGSAPLAQLWTEKAPDGAVEDRLEAALSDVLRDRALAEAASPAVVKRIAGLGAPFETRLASKQDGGSATARDTLEKVLPRVLAAGLAFFLLGNLVLLMTNTMEEKSNRIIEVLMSSITANQLMAGKLLGAAMIALFAVTFTVSALLGVFFMASDGAFASLAQALLQVVFESPILLALLFYFVTGFFLFAGLFIAIGSLCESTKDVQSLSAPVQYFLILVPILVWAIAAEPNGVGARILSYFPLTSPMMMMARINADPGWVDIVGSALAQVLGIFAMLWLSARVFRAGALRAGKPPKPSELWGAVRGEG